MIHYADGSEELYDLNKDPGEFVNLANDPRFVEPLKKLRKELPKSWENVMGPRFKKFADSFAKPPDQAPQK